MNTEESKPRLLAFGVAVIAGVLIYLVATLSAGGDEPITPPSASAPSVPTAPTARADEPLDAVADDGHAHDGDALEGEASDSPAHTEFAERFLAAYINLQACNQTRSVIKEIKEMTTEAIFVQLIESSPKRDAGDSCSIVSKPGELELLKRSNRRWVVLAAIPSQPIGRPLYFEIKGASARTAKVSYVEE